MSDKASSGTDSRNYDRLLPCPFCGGEATPKLAPYIGGGGCGHIVDCDECWSRTGYYSQKAEAIDAWNNRTTHGTLTAEQVRETVEKHWHDLPDEYDMPEAAALPEYSYDWQAIADELNGLLGSGTCHIEERNGDLYCDACDEMVGTCDITSELYIDGNAIELWNYCPNCGAKVIGG